MYGIDRLLADLRDLGFQAEPIKGSDGSSFAVISTFEIISGRFKGRVIDLGIPAPSDFPSSVGSSIHIRANPQLYEYNDSVPNVRNITTSVLGSDWRYWSKNFTWSGQGSTRRLISQINGIFENA